MDLISQWVAEISAWIWGPPMIILLLGGGLFLTIRLKFFQFRYFAHAMAQTVGRIRKNTDHLEGTLTPFQAFTSALASTAGATNIVGVGVAIAIGGPGAMFWMWAVALIGMASKYSEILLGVKYREKNEEGHFVGGPMYYIQKGLGWKWLAVLFAFGLMVEVIPSSMVQSNSISSTVKTAFGWDPVVTGIIITILTAIVVFGGVKRIGNVAEKIVPFMVIVYLIGATGVVLIHADRLPAVIADIFTHAFTPISATGGFAGAGIAMALRWGMARGAYSNEAGMGTAPIAHATAQTDHPARQGLWGVFSVFVDTLVICTMSGLAVLTAGTWTQVNAEGGEAALANAVPLAFGQLMGETAGSIFVSVFLLIFVMTTVGVLIFYGEKQAEYLFGLTFSKIMRVVYILSMFVGAVGGLKFVWQFLDILLAMIVVPNMIALLFMSKEVKEETEDYIENIYKVEKGLKKPTSPDTGAGA
ncbi:alanine/glycine:cation symporter family protein [Melghirimyces profundicolus]|uniref:alanine/glycine:cation symporter family protein n=1 Tax=Melghirimyces profundicolus TaxID=1242148 RepID=UPI001FEBDADA|nr:sodium:alanine symporter family protein [Melghirimyces profundicolus]